MLGLCPYGVSGMIGCMKKNVFLKFLVAELFTIVAVVATFRLVEERLIAGAIAGSIFSLLGIAIVIRGIRDRGFRSGFTFYAGCAHLFLSSLPLMITRFLNRAVGFEQVNVLGLPGPVFHKVSTAIFLLLIAATVIDAFRDWRNRRVAQAT